jgi:hypothetical protein
LAASVAAIVRTSDPFGARSQGTSLKFDSRLNHRAQKNTAPRIRWGRAVIFNSCPALFSWCTMRAID